MAGLSVERQGLSYFDMVVKALNMKDVMLFKYEIFQKLEKTHI